MAVEPSASPLQDLHLRAARAAEVMDMLPCAVFVCHFETPTSMPRYVFVSAQVEALLGVDAESILREPAARFRHVPADDTERILRTIRESAAGDGSWQQEFRVVIDGSERWIEGHARIYVREAQSIVAHGFWIDVTARKRLEERREESNSRFRSIFDSAPLAIGISDGAGNVTALNPTYTRTFGFDLRDAPTLPQLLELHYPDPRYREQIHRDWSASVEENRRTGNVTRPVISRMRCKDGGERVVEIRSAFAPHGEAIVIFNDITEQVQAREARARAEADRARATMQLNLQSSRMPMALIMTDADESLTIREWNPGAERIFGFHAEEMVGRSPHGLVIPAERKEPVGELLRMHSGARDTVRVVSENLTKDGRTIWCEWFNTPVVDASGKITRIMSMAQDISERVHAEERMRLLAQYDVLTGLPNRALLIDRLAQLIATATREQSEFAVLFLDLDRFKEVNDSMGHDAGDALLVAVAERLRKALRQSDTVARMGGDEFVMLLPQLREPEDAAVVARKLLDALREPLVLSGNELTLAGTIGICVFPADGADVGQLIRNADAAMYEAKSGGRNAYRFYTHDLNERARERLSLENALRRALKQQEFLLHYQPQIDLESGAIFGAEALMRWDRPGVGLVPPGQFIPLAEERGLIAGMGKWALAEAARQVATWNAAGIAITVAVNLSAVQFHQKGFVEHVAEVIAAHAIPAHQIELELTESIAIRDAQSTIRLLERLHELGVLLSIDDFGTGYSSLNYLRRFPIDRVKIDKSFVDEIAKHAGTARVVSGIIGLAKGLDLKVVAEGVETEAQLELLRKEGCDEAQGYLFSRPIPAPELEAFYRNWQPSKVTGATARATR